MSGEGYRQMDHIIAMLDAAIKCEASEFTMRPREMRAVHEALTTSSQGLDAATVERCADVAFVAAMKAGRGLEQAQQDAAFVRRALATDPHQHGGKGA